MLNCESSHLLFQGDFFFKIDKTLKFDGIFEVFPHPMYTVGYAWMYGSAMIAGSLQVLALTMFSHLMQMIFLGYVEDPHIQRTYGVEFEKTKSTHRENIFIINNFDPFRSSDWMMVIILVLFVNTTLVCGGVFGTFIYLIIVFVVIILYNGFFSYLCVQE